MKKEGLMVVVVVVVVYVPLFLAKFPEGLLLPRRPLMVRAARVPPRGAAASLFEVLPAAPRGETRRRRPVEC